MSRSSVLSKIVLTSRFGKINPESIEDYIKADGYKGLEKALKMPNKDVVNEIKESKLKGRGGAAFPTGIKMESVLNAKGSPKYLICNADEGEPGNFKDRYLMENDPHQLIEGIIISAYAVGAAKGYVYIRGEYNRSIKIISGAVEQARLKGYLGSNILNTGFSFDIDIFSGAGSYVCGEEFALMVSIEGNPGRSTYKPPFPTTCGLFNKPTLINNVETLSNIPYITLKGAEEFSSMGTESSSGTKLVSLSGNVNKPGLYEVLFGTTVRDIIFDLGEGIPKNRKIGMVQLGGASGPCIPENMLDLKLDYKETSDRDLSLGSGAIIVVDERYDILDIVKIIMEFFNHESCGKCTPCREGNTHAINILDKIISGRGTEKDLSLLESLLNVMKETSMCGLGQAAPTALITTLKYFREEYISKLVPTSELKAV